ncbi:MAG: class I SAM-dependent methyltransferase [Acidobacteria bacterium]|nr:class I SAM-dependent methyltransferase [Acidobacteriota bacterium]MBI3425356.1 class I SAM-dependent methyltransferase [Acidobacteriota bacterium]
MNASTEQTLDANNAEARSFDDFYQRQDQSTTLKAIFREALGIAELPAAIVPYSFVSFADLQRIAALLHVQAGQSLADLACGNGSLGLWLAQQTGAHLTGVDFSAAALTAAQAKAHALNLSAQSHFALGSLTATGLTDQSFDAAVSIDAIWLAHDQQQALHEAARILHPGAPLVFTSWEQHIPMPFVKQPVADYRPLLEQADFAIETYEHLPHSEALMKDIYARIRGAQAELLTEFGPTIQGLIGEAHFVPGLVDGVNYIAPENGPHVLVCARRL